MVFIYLCTCTFRTKYSFKGKKTRIQVVGEKLVTVSFLKVYQLAVLWF